MNKQTKKAKSKSFPREQKKREMDKNLDKKLKETFPASDSTATY
jgi:hypothetical protein